MANIGEVMSEEKPKHDGKIDEYSVTFHYNTVEIRDQRAEYVGLSAKQALSLLDWLTQNKPRLDQLVKENN